eukprot:gnl/Chilomastix_cuspidata/3262.p1 GENE.gnl/Chilomastix_cuspidata/3262~~gnl/Chilomastix_cuspidata/3262.p1  ORF type:complete len:780 (+),score=45.66 gnl/Chilomastix_cuspidata/3262:396-2735(+)
MELDSKARALIEAVELLRPVHCEACFMDLSEQLPHATCSGGLDNTQTESSGALLCPLCELVAFCSAACKARVSEAHFSRCSQLSRMSQALTVPDSFIQQAAGQHRNSMRALFDERLSGSARLRNALEHAQRSREASLAEDVLAQCTADNTARERERLLEDVAAFSKQLDASCRRAARFAATAARSPLGHAASTPRTPGAKRGLLKDPFKTLLLGRAFECQLGENAQLSEALEVEVHKVELSRRELDAQLTELRSRLNSLKELLEVTLPLRALGARRPSGAEALRKKAQFMRDRADKIQHECSLLERALTKSMGGVMQKQNDEALIASLRQREAELRAKLQDAQKKADLIGECLAELRSQQAGVLERLSDVDRRACELLTQEAPSPEDSDRQEEETRCEVPRVQALRRFLRKVLDAHTDLLTIRTVPVRNIMMSRIPPQATKVRGDDAGDTHKRAPMQPHARCAKLVPKRTAATPLNPAAVTPGDARRALWVLLDEEYSIRQDLACANWRLIRAVAHFRLMARRLGFADPLPGARAIVEENTYISEETSEPVPPQAKLAQLLADELRLASARRRVLVASRFRTMKRFSIVFCEGARVLSEPDGTPPVALNTEHRARLFALLEGFDLDFAELTQMHSYDLALAMLHFAVAAELAEHSAGMFSGRFVFESRRDGEDVPDGSRSVPLTSEIQSASVPAPPPRALVPHQITLPPPTPQHGPKRPLRALISFSDTVQPRLIVSGRRHAPAAPIPSTDARATALDLNAAFRASFLPVPPDTGARSG